MEVTKVHGQFFLGKECNGGTELKPSAGKKNPRLAATVAAETFLPHMKTVKNKWLCRGLSPGAAPQDPQPVILLSMLTVAAALISPALNKVYFPTKYIFGVVYVYDCF